MSSGSPLEPVVGYCRAVRVGSQVFVSGTAPVWPDGSVDPDPGKQAERCFEIIGEALSSLGAGWTDVVRTRMYLTDPAHFEAVGAVHGRHLAEVQPTCTAVVTQLLNPAWKVEIEVDAVVDPVS